jgi:hypothetical protein
MPSRRSTSAARVADMGTNSAKGWRSCIPQPGQHVVRRGMASSLLATSSTGLPRLRQQRQHLGVGQPEAARFDHEQHHVHVAQRRQHGAVERAVQRLGVLDLKARRVDEDELRGTTRAHAGDAVARGLRLVAGDADLLPHQRIEQRALAHVGAADDGHQAAALGSRGCRVHDRSGPPGRSLAFSRSSRRRAASCSAMRRERPSPCVRPGPARARRIRPQRSAHAPGPGWR